MPYTRAERRTYMRVYRSLRLAKAMIRLGGHCVKCGSTDRLEFHHVDPTAKVDDVTNLLDAPPEVFDAEVDKCELQCQDCHRQTTKDART